MPTTNVAKETTFIPPSQPNPAPSPPETSITEVPSKNSNPHRPMETDPVPPSAPSKSTLPVQAEEVPNSQDAVRPKLTPVERGTSEEDGEKPGPSGLNSHPSMSSSSAAPSAAFIPFSGGGQRLGGPQGGAAGRSLASSSSSSSLSALTAAVESPKAKKAKSSHGFSTKVSCITTTRASEESPNILF